MKDAKHNNDRWYMGPDGDGLQNTIYDANDTDEDDRHGMVCRDVVTTDAHLICAAPDLLRISKRALETLCDPYLGEDNGERQSWVIRDLERIIAKAEREE
jgi:hypothetical protein